LNVAEKSNPFSHMDFLRRRGDRRSVLNLD
jgi:hypothetical protein